MITKCDVHDIPVIHDIINDAAQAYKGAIPEDCWHEPYMTLGELEAEVEDGVEFWGYRENGRLDGVMGIQYVDDVTLIRHAYVRTSRRRSGIGSALLEELKKKAAGPILMGTWCDAVWAVRFYEKHGFRTLPPPKSARLLRRYWKISDRQVETSVVLAQEARFFI